MNSNTNNTGDKGRRKEVNHMDIALRILAQAMNDPTVRYRTTRVHIYQLCEFCCGLSRQGWAMIVEGTDGLDRLNEAIGFGLVRLKTAELLELCRHMPVTAEYGAGDHLVTLHDIATITHDIYRHEDGGGIETVTYPEFSDAFPDGGQPVWKLLNAPNPPTVFVAPQHPVCPQTPSAQQVEYSLFNVFA